MTVLTFERFPVDPAQVASFEQLAQERVERARAAAGMLWADLARCTDDPPSYVVLIEWVGEADAEAFEGSDDLHRFDPVLRGEVTRRRFVSGL